MDAPWAREFAGLWQSLGPLAYDASVILAGDIGGTKTHLALYRPGDSPRRPAFERILPSREHGTFDALARAFLADAGAAPTRAVLGVAGAVVAQRAATTNLPWHIDGAALGATIGARVTLLNDLEATAWGLTVLEASDLETLQPGEDNAGNRALVAAGTGLGEGLLAWDGACWRPVASEGGHADFGPRDPLEDELNVWLRGKYGRTSWERVLSGPGLADLYRFLSATGHGEEPVAFRDRFATAADPAATVTEGALAGACGRAMLALERFAEIYGAEAGNVALKFLAVGGVYVAGGIAPRILPVLRSGAFLRGFLAKGRSSALLGRMPVRIVLEPATALFGAAAVALRDGAGAAA